MKKSVFLLCSAHIDPVWLWPREEGVTEALATFETAARFCREYDGFVFNHNEALLYEWVERYDPELFAQIQSLVREGRAVRWQNGLAEKLRNLEQNVPSVRRVRVYQLKPDVDPARKFIGYQELKELSGGPALKEYREVFCGQLDTDNPDELYERFNAAKLPKGYRGHRLSISDLLELIGEDTSEFWYLDLNGFIPVKFDKEESEE